MKPCRGCVESGWQGLVEGSTGKRFHERVYTDGSHEVIPCTKGRAK